MPTANRRRCGAGQPIHSLRHCIVLFWVEIGKQPLARGVHELGVEIASHPFVLAGRQAAGGTPGTVDRNLRSESQLRLIIQHDCGRKRAPLR